MKRRFRSDGQRRFGQGRRAANRFASAGPPMSHPIKSCASPNGIGADQCTITTSVPVEYIILEFPDNRFTGEIVPEFVRLTEYGTVRLIDLIFITKDADSYVARFRIDEQLKELIPFSQLDHEIGPIISHEDVECVANDLEPNSSAALVVWEDTWAASLVKALRNSGAVFVEGGRFSAL